ncbi:MAG: HNH endonuclease signature motif containing protein [Thermoplasmata archaeon]
MGEIPAPVRVIRDSPGWFSTGRRRKAEARRMGRCAECFAVLERPRAIYCSPACRWRFHGRFFWDSARVVVMRRDRYTCRQCHRRLRRRQLEVDHIVEIAGGGAPLDYANLQTLCTKCHREKTRRFLTGRSPRRAARRPGRADAPAPEEFGDAPDWFPA